MLSTADNDTEVKQIIEDVKRKFHLQDFYTVECNKWDKFPLGKSDDVIKGPKGDDAAKERKESKDNNVMKEPEGPKGPEKPEGPKELKEDDVTKDRDKPKGPKGKNFLEGPKEIEKDTVKMVKFQLEEDLVLSQDSIKQISSRGRSKPEAPVVEPDRRVEPNKDDQPAYILAAGSSSYESDEDSDDDN
jgi:hypothetical protein